MLRISLLALCLPAVFAIYSPSSMILLTSSPHTLVSRGDGLLTPSVPIDYRWFPDFLNYTTVWESDTESGWEQSSGPYTFVDSFYIPDWFLWTNLDLYIGADDWYKVKLDGKVVVGDWTAGIPWVAKRDLKPFVESGKVAGVFRLEIDVWNYGGGPAGLAFKVEVMN